MKFKKGELKAEEDLVRYCSKCGCPLPSNHKQKKCDSCNREDASKLHNLISIVLAGLGGVYGFGKFVLPKIIKKF